MTVVPGHVQQTGSGFIPNALPSPALGPDVHPRRALMWFSGRDLNTMGIEHKLSLNGRRRH